MIFEIGKSYVKKFYNGNLKQCIQEKDVIIWTDERIKKAFNFGNGTIKDLNRYMHDNKEFCYFVEI